MDDFAVVTCHWNPAGWQSMRRNYRRFLHEMLWWNVPTFAVEVAYDGQEFASDYSWLRIRGSAKNELWQKERLLNLLVEQLPPQIQYVAWVDADCIFLDPEWVSKTRSALDRYTVVQMWDRWHCVGGDGAIVEQLQSIGHAAQRYIDRKAWSPGGALAARRDVFPLYDRNIIGSGDAVAMDAWTTDGDSRTSYQYTVQMRQDVRVWSETARRKVQGNVGSMKFDLVHLFHGSRRDRQYIDRWRPVREAGYDPQRHVRVDEQGLLAWTDEAPPQLVEWVRQYFASRHEDSTDRPYAIH